MKFSTKTRYGIRALIEIALGANNTGVFQKDIAVNQKLSIKYLDHIIAALKVAGLISNVKGKKSGYNLCRKAEEITMFDVYDAFETGMCLVECLDQDVSCELDGVCAVKEYWQELNDQTENYLKSVSIAELAQKHLILAKNK